MYKTTTIDQRQLSIMDVTHSIEIPLGKELIIEKRLIRIASRHNIVCHGTLVIRNCVIQSNEAGHAGCIEINGGLLKAEDCAFRNLRHFQDHYFIRVDGGDASFVNCKFDACSKFIYANKRLSVTNCEFLNCLTNTIRFPAQSKAESCNIKGSTIISEEIPSFLSGSLSDLQGNPGILCLETEHACVSDITITESSTFTKQFHKKVKYHASSYTYIYAGGVLEGLHLHDTSLPVCGLALVQNSDFENCSNTIYTSDRHSKYAPHIKDCNFIRCENVINADKRTLVEKCIFQDCSGSMVGSSILSFGGGIQVVSCRFLRCKNRSSGEKWTKALTSAANSLIFFNCGGSSATNRVEDCIFDGIMINEGYCIAPSTVDAFPGYLVLINNCEFKNCFTNRNDCKIIKEDVSWYGRFGKGKSARAVRISKCVGLQDVRNDFIDDFDNLVMDENGFIEGEFDEFAFDEDDLNYEIEESDIPDGNQCVTNQRAGNAKKNISTNTPNQGTTEDVAAPVASPSISQIVGLTSILHTVIQQKQEESAGHESDPQEKLIWSDPIAIDTATSQTVSNKHVVIGSAVKVYGDLTFANCEIEFQNRCQKGKKTLVYNGKITLLDSAKLSFKNCRIRCAEKDDNSDRSIGSEGKLASILFENCKIDGKTHFMSTYGVAIFIGCTIENAPKDFITRVDGFVMDNCRVIYDQPPNFKGFSGNSFYGSAIHVGDKKATSYIKNSTIEIKGESPAKLVDHWGREIPCVDDKAGIFDAMITIKVENCRFINIKRQLFAPYFDTRKFSLKDCQFINCEKDIIKGAKKENCTFE